jgi:hypothetical protein
MRGPRGAVTLNEGLVTDPKTLGTVELRHHSW